MMKKIALYPTICAALLSMNISAADAPKSESASSARPPQVPAARGPALELAIEAARTAIEACSADGGQKVAASVVDSAGVLKVLLATDGTSPRGVTSSTNKAVTALKFKSPTSALGEQVKNDKTLADQVAADVSINVRPGGVLLKVGDEIIGAIGIGGGRTDEPCALAGIKKIQSRLQ
jgi:uncharacterized protein GlcG (DUF336 family)